MTVKTRIIILNIVAAGLALLLGGALVRRSYTEAHQLRNFSKVSLLLRELFLLGDAWTYESGGVWQAHPDYAAPGKLQDGIAEYKSRIAKTQAAVARIEASVAALPLTEFSQPFQDMIRHHFDFEKRLAPMRTGILTEHAHPWQTTLRYNHEIKGLIGMIPQLATETTDSELARKVIVADLTLQAQLMIGRHNGLLSHALTTGDVNEASTRFPTFMDDLRPLLRRIEALSSPEGVRLFRQYVDNDMLKTCEAATELVIKAGPPPASGHHAFDKAYAARIKQTYLDHDKGMANFISFVQTDVHDYTQQRIREANIALYSSLTAVGIAVMLSLGGGFFTIRRITRSIRDVSGQLRAASNQGSEQAQLVSNAATNLADGCSQQASAIEEIHATVEEITSTAAIEAERVRSVLKLAGESDASVAESSSSTKQMRGAMQRIQESSAQIANIAKAIEEIAFQTNILALNAAVEAARAGEAGAGFAIVADEVRSLARKSADSAKSTHEMIETAIRSVQEGTALSEEVENQLGRIFGQIGSFKTAMVEMQHTSERQRVALGQVATSIGEIDKVTQRNAAASEESASAAHEMEEQSYGVLRQIEHLEKVLIGAEAQARFRVTPPFQAQPRTTTNAVLVGHR